MQARYSDWKDYLPFLKGEMTELEYEAYASSHSVKNV